MIHEQLSFVLLTEQTEQTEQKNHSKIKWNTKLRLLYFHTSCLAVRHLQNPRRWCFSAQYLGKCLHSVMMLPPGSPSHGAAPGPGQEHRLPQRWLPPVLVLTDILQTVFNSVLVTKRKAFGQYVAVYPGISGGSTINRFLWNDDEFVFRCFPLPDPRWGACPNSAVLKKMPTLVKLISCGWGFPSLSFCFPF